MKKLLLLFLCLLFILVSCEFLAPTPSEKPDDNPIVDPDPVDPDPVDPDPVEPDFTGDAAINIFEINDTHGALVTSDSGYGMDNVASIIKGFEKEDLILVANGDIFQGGYVSNETRGKIFIDVLNELSFDCFVLGNHEFDWGLEEIHKFKDGDISNGEANFPFLGCNIYEKKTNKMVDWLEPYTIVEREGIKIGIIGAIGYGLESSITSFRVADYKFLDPVPLISKYATELRNECDSVIVSIHDYDESTLNRIAKLSGSSMIDGVICGHTHQYISEYYNRTDNYRMPVVQSNTKNLSVGSIILNFSNFKISSTKIEHYEPKMYPSDQDIYNLMMNYKSLFDESNEIIGYTSSNINKSRLGNFAANAIKKALDVDYGCLNTGGVRTTIDRGDITVAQVYEVFPFDNELIIVSLAGSVLKDLYNVQGGYLYISDASSIYGLDDNTIYKFAIVDYAFYQSYYTEYFNNAEMVHSGMYIRDIVIDEIRNNGV